MARVQLTISTPTDFYDETEQPRGNGYHHLMPHLRLGRMSGEEFAKAKVNTIPVDPDAYDGSYEASTVVKKMVEPKVKGEKAKKKPSTDKSATTKARKKKSKDADGA